MFSSAVRCDMEGVHFNAADALQWIYCLCSLVLSPWGIKDPKLMDL